VTYAQLREAVDQKARALREMGHESQDRVAIWSENSVFFIVSYLAVIRAGLVAVPLQTDSSPKTGIRIVKETAARTVLGSRRFRNKVNDWAPEAGAAVFDESDLGAPARDKAPLPELNSEDDLAALMFTSGSTGAPKGVMVTHGNIACNTADIVHYLGLGSDDRAMLILPLYYCFGLSVLHSHLAVGGSIVINNQFTYPEKVLAEIDSRSCTGLAGVPSTYQILLRNTRFKKSSFPSLRWIQQAGGALPNRCIGEIVEAFQQVRFYVMYGQTEGSARLSYLPPERLGDKLGSVGRGLPSTRLDVLRSDGTPVKPGSDEVGEIVASGKNIALGYWNDEEETAKYFRNGRLYTGDLARVDRGFVYIVEREREMIKSGGNRVSPREIEDVIAECSEVVEAAVVGAPHEILGEAIVAFVVLSTGAESQAPSILDHCRRKLPPFKTPELVIHLSRLPYNGTGKVLKASLKPLAADLLMPASSHKSSVVFEDQSIRTLGIERCFARV
jgi:acyl-CoA synthetase (AMP-forming)/AMP-acid ligase II